MCTEDEESITGDSSSHTRGEPDYVLGDKGQAGYIIVLCYWGPTSRTDQQFGVSRVAQGSQGEVSRVAQGSQGDVSRVAQGSQGEVSRVAQGSQDEVSRVAQGS